jgi:hypothetical protein
MTPRSNTARMVCRGVRAFRWPGFAFRLPGVDHEAELSTLLENHSIVTPNRREFVRPTWMNIETPLCRRIMPHVVGVED